MTHSQRPTAPPVPDPVTTSGAHPGFAIRLLTAQALVLVAGALTCLVVALAIAPGIFHEHLRRAGLSLELADTVHLEGAFGTAMIIAVSVALLVAAGIALAVTWYFGRRVQRSIADVVGSAIEVAAGRYSSRVSRTGLGAEFDQLAAAFNQLAERLDAVETSRRRMLADLAHEMRTPLATLDAHIEALEDGVRTLDPTTRSVLKESTQRLSRLAQDIVVVSRAQEGTLDIHRTLIAPRTLVDTAAQGARERYRAKGVTLLTEVNTDVTVSADSERMGQVLGNLLDNALRHTPVGGSVTLICRTVDAWVEFAVEDSGEGIEPEHLSHVFDRFYRADTSRNRAQAGSGIGLTIAKTLVDAHGGTISARSTGRGRGATFVVRIPR